VVGIGCVRIHRRNRCGVRNVQRGGFVATTSAGSYVEQCVVSAVGVRRYQLHEELGVRGVCRGGIVDRSIYLDDIAPDAASNGRNLRRRQMTGIGE